MIINILSLLLLLFIPVRFSRWILNLLGHKIDKKAKVGLSIVWKTKLELEPNAQIGHFNIIYINNLQMQKDSLIRHRNIFIGKFVTKLGPESRIGKQNRFTRSHRNNLVIGISELNLGVLACVTKEAVFDLTTNITLGDYSQIAGVGTQIWTHGYVHAKTGPERIRVDGEVKIGNNVYVGSRCLINPGVIINDSINIGGNSTIAKSLIEPGMYVSQPLRYLPKDYESIKEALVEVTEEGLIEKVFEKKH